MLSIQLWLYGHHVCWVHGKMPIRGWTITSLSLRASGSSWTEEEWCPNPQLTRPCPAPLRACYGLIMGSKCFPLGVQETKCSFMWQQRGREWHMTTWNKSLIHTSLLHTPCKYGKWPILYFDRLIPIRTQYGVNLRLLWLSYLFAEGRLCLNISFSPSDVKWKKSKNMSLDC